MAKYRVAICRSVFNYVEVEAESEDAARERAADVFDSPGFDRTKTDGISEDYDTLVVESNMEA